MQILSANTASIINAYQGHQQSLQTFTPRQQAGAVELIPAPQYPPNGQNDFPSFSAPQGNYIDLYV